MNWLWLVVYAYLAGRGEGIRRVELIIGRLQAPKRDDTVGGHSRWRERFGQAQSSAGRRLKPEVTECNR